MRSALAKDLGLRAPAPRENHRGLLPTRSSLPTLGGLGPILGVLALLAAPGPLAAQDAPTLTLHGTPDYSFATAARTILADDDDLSSPAPADRFEIRLSFGAGNMDHDTDGSDLDGDTDAGYFLLQFEGYGSESLGGGIRIEGAASDDDIFIDSLGPDTEAMWGEIYLYLAHRLERHRWRTPLRFGVALNQYTIEQTALDLEVEYTTAALKVEAEPEFEIIAGDALRWTLYGGVSAGIGLTEIETDPSTIDDDTTTILFGVDLGTRLQFGPVLAGAGFVVRQIDVDEGDDFFGVTNRFSGLQLTVGLRW